MTNIITASIEFYFKGKKFSPSITLELDPFMQSGGRMPVLYPLIANQNNIDLYSYEYEMMQAEEIKFRQADGLVADYIINGVLDISAFELAWHDQQAFTEIQQLIEQHKLSHLIKQHPELEQILLAVYKLGEKGTAK